MSVRRAVSGPALAALSLVPFIGCTAEEDPPVATGIVNVGENVTSPATWDPSNVYVVERSISITAALVIEPGTIVKLAEGVSVTVDASGSIDAGGSASAPCVFTSVKDDAHGGDTNADAEATTPARGDWGSIVVREDGTVLDHCELLYGGAGMPYSGALVLANDCSATITNCTLAHNQGGTPTDLRAAALNATYAGAGTVIAANRFFDNDVPLVVNGVLDIDGSNVFGGVVGSQTITNTYDGIFWNGPYALGGDIAWTNTEVPFVIAGPLMVPAGYSLTLGDGVIVKLAAGQRIDVSGVLIADATSEIVFTSLLDDGAGGDTNGDGSLTAPAPGDWRSVTLSADGSVLNRCRFTYGGTAAPYTGTVAVTHDSVVTITNSTFAHNQGGTLADNRAAALNAGGAAAGTVITGNLFYDNDMPLVINGLVNVDDSNVFHYLPPGELTPLTNALNGIFLDGVLHAVSGSVTWSNTEVAYVMLLNCVLSIQAQGTLSLGDGVVLKFAQGGRIDLHGALAESGAVVYTSLADDARAGDTNGDGDATAPADGDWPGINDCSGGGCVWSGWSNILYAANP